MKRIALTALVLAASLALFASQVGQRVVAKLDAFSDWIVVNNTAYGFLPPLRVSEGNIFRGTWSLDGNFYLGLGRGESGPFCVRYAVGSARANPIILPKKGEIRGYTAVHGGLFVFSIAGTYYLFNANLQRWQLFEGTQKMSYCGSTTRAMGDRVLLEFRPTERSNSADSSYSVLYDVSVNGAFMGPIRCPLIWNGYGLDGSVLMYETVEQKFSNFHRWNGTYWVPAPTAKLENFARDSLPGDEIVGEISDVKLASGPKFQAGVLRIFEKKEPGSPPPVQGDRWSKLPTEVLISAPMKAPPDPSPTLSAVAYIQTGVLYIRPTIRIPVDEFRKALHERWRTQALMNAKQSGGALRVYASDYDDMLPDGTDIFNKLLPYVIGEETLSSFVYTFPGGNLKQIQAPADTELGYIPGPGGRAVVYADGHAKWIPDK